jgi:nicotinamide-nucleotide amidase
MNRDSSWPSIARNSAHALADRLKQRSSDRVVFAESCTCGLVAALLGQCPGVSEWLCGSAVTYRESVKQQWLSVAAETLEEFTAESLETTCEMAIGVLQKTGEAGFSAAVTGHLGPDAPPEIDGRIFLAVATLDAKEPKILAAESCQLTSPTRVDRQHEAANHVFQLLMRWLE